MKVMHELDEEVEGGHVEEDFGSRGGAELDEEFGEAAVESEFFGGAEFGAVGFGEVNGEEDDHYGEGAQEGAQGGADDAHGGQAEFSEDEDPVGGDVHEHSRGGGEHDDAGAAQADEEAG